MSIFFDHFGGAVIKFGFVNGVITNPKSDRVVGNVGDEFACLLRNV